MTSRKIEEIKRELAENDIEFNNRWTQEIIEEAIRIADPEELDPHNPHHSVASLLFKLYGKEAIEVAKLLEQRAEEPEFARLVRLRLEAILGLN